MKIKYVESFTDRNGHRRFYFRRPRRGARIALPDPGNGKTPNKPFLLAYEAILGGPVADGHKLPHRLTPEGLVAKAQGSIYAVGFRGWVKIGFSRFPAHRLKSLQTGIPESATLIGTIPGTLDVERALHLRFANHRETGEWFRHEGHLAEWLEATFKKGWGGAE